MSLCSDHESKSPACEQRPTQGFRGRTPERAQHRRQSLHPDGEHGGGALLEYRGRNRDQRRRGASASIVALRTTAFVYALPHSCDAALLGRIRGNSLLQIRGPPFLILQVIADLFLMVEIVCQ